MAAEQSGAREVTCLHLGILFRMVCERAWDADGPSLAVIPELLPEKPREVRFEQILAVLERIGVEPRDYFREVSRESWWRELEALALRYLGPGPQASGSSPSSELPSRPDVDPIVE